MSAERRIALLTRIWPTKDRPSVGTFVRERATGVPGLQKYYMTRELQL